MLNGFNIHTNISNIVTGSQNKVFFSAGPEMPKSFFETKETT